MEGMTPERPVISERLRFTLAEMKAEGVMGWPNVISDAIAHIDAQQRTIEEKEAEVARLRESIELALENIKFHNIILAKTGLEKALTEGGGE